MTQDKTENKSVLQSETATEHIGQGLHNSADRITKSLMSPSPIWKSRIGWRITLSVFVTMVVVQISLMMITLNNFENEKLLELKEIARSAIVPSLENQREQLVSPISKADAQRLVNETVVEGVAVYALDYSPITYYGETVLLTPREVLNGTTDYRSSDLSRYETIFTPVDLGRPYNIVMRIDASNVQPLVLNHIKQNVIILLLLSGFVTSVLMLALGQWLLEPIMLLRGNLLEAAKNPENPNIKRASMDTRDEVGMAVRIANDLIRQNANNLKRLRVQAEDKIHKLAYFDALTGLPNRTQFIDKLEETIKTDVIKGDARLAVLAVDLDHFKDINDTMGHEIGDKLLDAVGKRLSKAVPEGSLVARSSADEFAVMVMLDEDNPDSTNIIENIFTSISEPISILQERFQIRTSIGVAHCPDDGVEAGQILKNADIALNRSKAEGRDTVRYYSEDFDKAVQQRFQMLRDLRQALTENQLQLHYHPQFHLETGAMIGAEALLRWWRPDNSKEGGSFVSPVEFIPIAEQSGLIVPIGEWVLRTACKMNKEWQKSGMPPFRIAVNISGVQFHRGDIVAMVDNVLKETGLDPKWLELEVTESVFMENMDVAIDILHQLHGLGVELAVDDFGTGYSSLSYLRQFPIDRLKIDQSFTKNALVDPGDATITRTIITLGHSLGLKVIAEGVETTDHEDFLREEGCDEVQGFKYTKPIPADQLREFALKWNRNLAKEGNNLRAVD